MAILKYYSKFLVRLFIVVLFSCCQEGKLKQPEKPNIIVILTDDLGYNDLGCYGTQDKTIKTPNIDRLARQGIRFTDWQSANSVCAPSRAALLTGRYNPRNGQVVVSHPFNKEQYEHLGLYQDEITIPEILKPLGYVTAAFGKWHMGEHYDYRPLRHGFDYYFGEMHNIHAGQSGELYRGDSSTQEFVRYEHIHERITNEAKKIMRDSKDKGKPFFVYMSHYLVHGPWEPGKRFATEEEWAIREASKGGIHHKVYPAMVRELDWHVGEIMKEIEQLGIADNTVLFFTSDNGPWLTNDPVRSAGSTGALRGSKFNTFEGGHRVPGIVKYPGKIPAGQVSNELVSTMDIMPTIAYMTGASLPKDRIIDGKNIWELLSGQENAKSPHKVLFGYHGKNLQTVRKDSWKLHLPRTPESVPFYAQRQWGRGSLDSIAKPMLFNLKTDIGEQYDVADSHPEVVKDLLREAQKMREELGDWNVIGNDEHDYNGFEGDIHDWPVRNRK